MAGVWYAPFRQAVGHKQVDWQNDDFRALCVVTGTGAGHYTLDRLAHATLADVPSGARVFMTDRITIIEPAAGLGVFYDGIVNADPYLISAITGPEFQAVIIIQYVSAAVETSRLGIYVDSGPGLPAQPNGGPMRLLWNTDADKIGRI